MIISCEQCSTRFKVGDEKFAHGPIRVRCSKCNHVFLAQPPAAAAATAATSSLPAPITGFFKAPDLPPTASTQPPTVSLTPQQTGGFNSPGNRSGIFRPPTQSMPATAVNAALSSTLPPTTATLSPFGSNPLNQPPTAALPATTVNPSLSQPPSTALPSTSVMQKPQPDDPFRGLDSFGRKMTPAHAPSPSAASHLPPVRAPTPDPFAPRQTPGASKPDPFGAPALTSPQTPKAIGDPFGLGATPPQPRPDPFAGLGGRTPSSASNAFNPSGQSSASPFNTTPPPGFGASPSAAANSSLPPGFGAPSHPTSPPGFGTPGAFTPPPSPVPAERRDSSSSLASPFGAAGGEIGDPFAGFGNGRQPTKNDPFAGLGGSPSPSVPTMDPFRPPSQITSVPPAGNDPFSTTESMNASSLFPSQSQGDPFGGNGNGNGAAGMNGNGAGNDGDINIDLDSADVQVEPAAPPPSAGMIGVTPGIGNDPFGGLDDANDGAADAQSLFDAPAPPPRNLPAASSQAPTSPPAPSTTTPPMARGDSGHLNMPQTGADMVKLRKLETSQRVKELAWAAAQGLLLLVFIAVAVVIARGGRVDDVMRGDYRAALGGARASGDLAVEEPHVERRTLPSGIDVVVVTGVVNNMSQKSIPGALVNVRFGAPGQAGGAWFSGWAWSSVDGVDVDRIIDAPDTAPLSRRGPTSASLAPGDRAPFVIVAPAPQEGLKASFVVQAAPSPG